VKKKPRFFCDNCGYEVGSDVKSCPYCGRFFASVRCPACDYSGPDRMFQNGCPMCGYSDSPTTGKHIKIKKPRPEKKHTQPAPAPLAYVFAVVILIAFIALFSWFITH
jgi:RNA polymerase subunit RPABC4/transcription elongation factor Spt4